MKNVGNISIALENAQKGDGLELLRQTTKMECTVTVKLVLRKSLLGLKRGKKKDIGVVSLDS